VNIAAWVMQDGQAPLNMTIAQAVCNPGDGGGNTFSGGIFRSIPAGTWTLVSGTVTVPTGCATVQLLFGQNGAATFPDGGPQETADGGQLFPDLFVDDVFIGQ
jgi:hypothetical protein